MSTHCDFKTKKMGTLLENLHASLCANLSESEKLEEGNFLLILNDLKSYCGESSKISTPCIPFELF